MTSKSRRWFWMLLLVPIVLGLARLRFDVEVLNLLPANSSVVQGLKLYQQNFANARELILTVSAPDAEKAESAARSLAVALRQRSDLVAEAIWQPPWLEHPAQAAELVAFLWLNQPPHLLAPLTDRLSPANLSNTLAEAREQLATSLSPNDLALSGYDPLGLMRLPEGASAGPSSGDSGQEFFASADGTFRVLFIEAARDLGSYKDCVKWFDAVNEVVAHLRASPEFPSDVVIGYTGRPAFVAEIGGGMERDLTGPSAGTLLVIALLFYLAHRCWRPLFWLLALLILILAGTLGLGGLLYGALNVMSLGFASILLGLAEDFAIVLYQESRTHPGWSLQEIRRESAPGIWWSAITTAGAFLLLNLSGLPGLGQLGTLVAIGVGLAAVVMLYAYLPPLLTASRLRTPAREPVPVEHPAPRLSEPRGRTNTESLCWIGTALLTLTGLFLLWRTPPRFDRSPDVLRPKNSFAYATLAEIKLRLNRQQEPLWVVITGHNEAEVSRRLVLVEPVLRRAVSNRVIAGFTLPTALWPDANRQASNRPATTELARRGNSLSQAILTAGFSTNALPLTENILRAWQLAGAHAGVFWPTNDNSRWILEKLTARSTNGLFAIGLIHPVPGGGGHSLREMSALDAQLPRDGVWLSGWELLGPSLAETVRGELYRVVLPILALVLVSLWLAFRDWREVVLSLATLVFSGLGLHVVMVVTGWSWNMMNLMALPLLLGMGVDFGIHMQLALRRSGDVGFVRRSVGRALLLAGATTVAGFASLGLASNAGIAALGKVCAAGILCAMLTAIYLLPIWWARFGGGKAGTP